MKVTIKNSNVVFERTTTIYKNILSPIESHVGKLFSPVQYGLTDVSFTDDPTALGSVTKYYVGDLNAKTIHISMVRMAWVGCVVFVGEDGKVIQDGFYKTLQDENYKKVLVVSADINIPYNAVYMLINASSHYVSIGENIKYYGKFYDITNAFTKTRYQRALGEESDTAFRTLNYQFSNKAMYVADSDCLLKVSCSTYMNKIYTAICIVNGAGIDVTLPDGKVSHALEAPAGKMYIANNNYVLKLKQGDIVYINYQDSDYVLPSDQTMYEGDTLTELKIEKAQL